MSNDGDKPLSSEELIRRAREDMTRSDPTPGGDTAPAIEDEPPTDATTPETDPSFDEAVGFGTGDADELADSRWERPPAPPPPPPPPAPASSPAPGTDLPPRPEWEAPGIDPAPSPWEPPPIEKGRGFWSRLGAIRGWVFGGIAAVFLFAQCFSSGTTLDDLDIGACFEDPGLGEEISTVDTIDCNKLHDFELYATVILGGSDRIYPGDDPVLEEVAAACEDRFEAFVGHDYFTSVYDYVAFTPVEAGWKQGDRTGMCALYEFDNNFNVVQSIGSGRNSGR